MIASMEYAIRLLTSICATRLLSVCYAQEYADLHIPRDGPGDLITGNLPYETMLWDVGGPKYQDVAQGTNGDCWLDAALAAVAYTDKAHLETEVMNKINDLSGHVEVTLWDGANAFVNNITMTDTDTYSSSMSDTSDTGSAWPGVMEMAFKAFAEKYPDVNIDPTLIGGTLGSALSALYGSKRIVNTYSISLTSDTDLFNLCQNATNVPTTCRTESHDNQTMTPNGLPTHHSYTLMGCDKDKQGNITVELRNPWGFVSQTSSGSPNNGGRGVKGLGDGKFSVSFEDWKANWVESAAVS